MHHAVNHWPATVFWLALFITMAGLLIAFGPGRG